MYFIPFRTDTMYEDALISKMFVFSFVNSYASLFFVAFIKTYVGEKCTGGCFAELSYQLTTIFGLALPTIPFFTIDHQRSYVFSPFHLLYFQLPSSQWRKSLRISHWWWIKRWRIEKCSESTRNASFNCSGISKRKRSTAFTFQKLPEQKR